MMAKTVTDKINDYLQKLPDVIEKGITAVVIREIDRYALEFLRRVEQDTPYRRLKGAIRLERTFKRGKYGYRLLFDGKDKNNVSLQMIANVTDYGRTAGSGVAESGRRYAYGEIEGIKFMTKHLELLGQINKEIAKNLRIEEWIVTENGLRVNDGNLLSLADLERYEQKEGGIN